MKTKFDNILFDLDGTISDSFKGIENGIKFSLNKCGVSNINIETIKKMIGLPLHQSLQLYYFDDDEQKIKEAIVCFRDYYNKIGVYESLIYPRIFELLHELKSKSNLHIITAKPEKIAINLLKHHNLAHCFTSILGYKPELLDFKKSDLINSLNISNNGIMIGDKKQDIIAGQQSNMFTAGVLYGYGTKQEIEDSKPDYIVNSVEELKEILL